MDPNIILSADVHVKSHNSSFFSSWPSFLPTNLEKYHLPWKIVFSIRWSGQIRCFWRPFWGFPWIPLRISPPKMGVWTSDFHSHPVTPSIEKHRASWMKLPGLKFLLEGFMGIILFNNKFCPGTKKNKQVLFGGNKTMEKTTPFGDLFYHLDASINFLPTTSALF